MLTHEPSPPPPLVSISHNLSASFSLLLLLLLLYENLYVETIVELYTRILIDSYRLTYRQLQNSTAKDRGTHHYPPLRRCHAQFCRSIRAFPSLHTSAAQPPPSCHSFCMPRAREERASLHEARNTYLRLDPCHTEGGAQALRYRRG